jgi:putative phosphoesterase
MQIALISDIHGNFTALDAVLKDIHAQGIDKIICLGDVATLGPQPREVIAAVREINCPVIKGNHETALLDLERMTSYGIGPTIETSIQWCHDLLDQDDLDYLDSFLPTFRKKLDDQTDLFCFHGSPLANTDMIVATTPPEDLNQFFDRTPAQIMVGGHTHIQMLRQHDGILVVNPGSVGTPFVRAFQPGVVPELLPWAEYAILTWNEEQTGVDFRRVTYDRQALLDIVQRCDIPIQDWWLEYLPE